VGVRVGSLRTKSVLELRFRAGLGLRSSDARYSSAKRDVQLTTRLRCAIDNIQQFMQGLVVMKTLLFYLD